MRCFLLTRHHNHNKFETDKKTHGVNRHITIPHVFSVIFFTFLLVHNSDLLVKRTAPGRRAVLIYLNTHTTNVLLVNPYDAIKIMYSKLYDLTLHPKDIYLSSSSPSRNDNHSEPKETIVRFHESHLKLTRVFDAQIFLCLFC